jgi:two-component system chemotaxis sensor kinase CheA
MDIEKYKKIFAQESDKYLENLDELLLRAENRPTDRKLWTEIHGKLHSIKGMARALSFDHINHLSHNMEDWCERFQQGLVQVSSEAIQLLFDGSDVLRLLVSRMDDIGSVQDQRMYDYIIARLHDGPDKIIGKRAEGPKRVSSNRRYKEKINYVRVKYSLIEELLGLSKETMLLEKTLAPSMLEKVPSEVKSWIGEYSVLLKGMHFKLAQLRLMSIGDFAELFIKPIRNLAWETGKKVNLRVQGAHLEADITLLERLREPLLHILRNAIAHGIEAPAKRLARGKAEEGLIRLEAQRLRDNLYLKIIDDGRGIDRDAIIDYLKRIRSFNEEEIEALTPEQFYRVILSSDFSSSIEVTDLAGRGIGMNVVSQAIEYLGGTLAIRSTPGQGTQFIVRLPVSLSIIHALVFELGPYRLAVPTADVVSIERNAQPSAKSTMKRYNLKPLFDSDAAADDFHYLIRIKANAGLPDTELLDAEIGLGVDNISGNNKLMIMPVGDLIARAAIFAGVGIMENGEIAVVLDTANLPEHSIINAQKVT